MSTPHYKVVTLGNTATGKTTLIHRLKTRAAANRLRAEGRSQEADAKEAEPCHTEPTIGCEFHAHSVQLNDSGSRCKLHIWDTAGGEQFRAFTANFLRGARAALMVFDVSNPQSFADLPDWYDELRNADRTDALTVVVAAKCDLPRRVSAEEAKAFAAARGSLYAETSAVDNVGICEIFEQVAHVVAKEQGDSSPGLDIRLPPDRNNDDDPHPKCGSCAC